MGGAGSGNYGGKPTIEAALKLDLHHLIRTGSFRPSATVTGSLAWTDGYTGEQRACIGYRFTWARSPAGSACATPPQIIGPASKPSTITECN